MGETSGVRPAITSQWFAALYESPVLFSGLLDRAGNVLAANRLSVEGCGFDRSETIGRRFREDGWWSPDSALAERVRGWCGHAVETGRSLSAVSRYFRADGSIGMVELGLVPIIDFETAGHPVSHIVATGLDVSPLLSAQAAREDRLAGETRASRQAEQRFRDALNAMIDNVTAAHSLRDRQGTIVDFEIDFANVASVDGAGRSAADLIGCRVSELYPLWRDSGMFARFVAVVETGKPFVGNRIPYDDVLDDGTLISGHWDIRVSKLDDGYLAASRERHRRRPG